MEKTVVGLYQVKDFGELYTDEFELTTSFRNDFVSGITYNLQLIFGILVYWFVVEKHREYLESNTKKRHFVKLTIREKLDVKKNANE